MSPRIFFAPVASSITSVWFAMPLSPQNRENMLAATREAAAAFLEDMAHCREILQRRQNIRGDLRRVTGSLRRILIDNGGDLPDIAALRIGRIHLLIPDNNPIYRAEKGHPYQFFCSAGGSAISVNLRGFAVEASEYPHQIENFDPDRTVAVRPDNFLSQRVLCLQGTWITRRDVIKYMANIASGVHSGNPKDDIARALARMRHPLRYKDFLGRPQIHFDFDALQPVDRPFRHEENTIDPVLVEVLSAMHYLSVSPDVIRLESIIASELSSAP